MFICKQKNNLIPQIFFLRYYTLKHPVVWLVNQIGQIDFQQQLQNKNFARHGVMN